MGRMNANQKRRKQLRPPLSSLDKALYCLIIAILIFFIFFPMYAACQLPRWVAFHNPAVVAYSSHSNLILTCVLLTFTSMSLLFLLASLFYSMPPIFGNKAVQYGCTPWPKNFYPLFDPRRKNSYKPPSVKKQRYKAICAWALALVCLLFLSSLEFCGRDVLDRDNRVTAYNAVNCVTDVYDPDDFSHLSLITHHYRVRAGGGWQFALAIRMDDGKEFTFYNINFDSEDDATTLCLETMLSVKALFSEDEIDYIGAENTGQVAEYYQMDQDQLSLLQELFTP